MLQSMFGNYSGYNSGMTTQPWQAPQTDQRKTINSTLPGIMGTQTPTATTAPATNGIGGVTYNKPTGWVDEYGGNGELTGVSNWGSYFSGLENLGEGQQVQDVQSIGGSNPTGFTITRQDPNGDPNYYQKRQLTINPDGTVAWADGSNWVSQKQQSQMGHFLEAGLPMALAMVGGINFLGGATGGLGGAAGGLEGMSGMDLAADAALGSGNNIFTAGQALGGAGAAGAGAAIPGSGFQAPAAGSTSGAGLNLSGAAPGSVYGTGSGLGIAPEAIGAATGGTGLGAMIGSTIPAGSALAGLGAGSGLAGSLLGQVGKTVGGNVASNLVEKVLGGSSGGISNLGNLGSLFTNYQQYNNMKGLIDEIKSIYKPDGVYAKNLEGELARRDAAAGRNSQYGPRLTELNAKLGDSQARALSGLGGLFNTQQGGLNGMVGSGQRLLEGTGLGGLISQGLQGLFNNQGGMIVGEAGSTPGIWDRPMEDIDWEELWGG